MKRLVVVAMVATGAACALAMPTKEELEKAQPLVVELMAPAMAKFKSAEAKDKAAAAVTVGDASTGFAKSAETEAAKFLFLKGAVDFYVRGGEYEKAADAVATVQSAIKDVPSEVIAEIAGKAAQRVSEMNAPQLFVRYRVAKRQVCAAGEAKALAEKLQTEKSDALQRKYAEALAVSGDWKSAYAAFAKVEDAKLKEVCTNVAAAVDRNAEAGEFWWSYKPANEDAEDVFKAHAAAFYLLALADGEVTGIKKKLLRQRIAEQPECAIDAAFPPFGYSEKSKDDIVYELRIMDVKQDGGTAWNYTDKAPACGMEKFSTVDYADEELREGKSPLSKENGWEAGKTEYWVRKEFVSPVGPSGLSGGYLLVDADKTVEVWLNGKEIYKADGRTWYYHKRTFDASAVNQGRNVIAVRVQIPQGKDAGYLDLGMFLQGRGQYGYAKLFAGTAKPLIPVDMSSFKETNAVVKSQKHGGADWRYSTVKPADGWLDPDFDDSSWTVGKGGFAGGTRPHFNPFVDRKHTKWDADDIWMRTTFEHGGGESADVFAALVCFQVQVWGDFEIYLNGKKIIDNRGLFKAIAASGYECDMLNAYDLTAEVRSALRKGKNVLAVFVHQPPPGINFWARYADVGLYLR